MKQETEEKSQLEILKEEATNYYQMAKEYRRERYMKDESEVKILK
jgi:hypothetical protein